MVRILGGACVVLACSAGMALAAADGELWEVSTQMNMAGMPPGMGSHTSRVCSEKGDAKKAMSPQGNDKCKMTDFKQSGNTVRMTMSCPEGTAVLENTYSADRSSYKGTMKMTTRQGEMTMDMTGRKVGTCDAQQAKAERNQQIAAAQRQSEQANAQIKASEDEQIANCTKAVETMRLDLLGNYARCDLTGSMCESLAKGEHTRRVGAPCMAKRAEFCKRYQTMEGFTKAGGNKDAATACGVSREEVLAAQCPRAAQAENLAFLGRYCPVEAKPIAQQHCAGRSYTSQTKDKYSEFCSTYLAHASIDEPGAAARRGRTEATTEVKTDPKEALQQGVTQGINKLKGLFGR